MPRTVTPDQLRLVLSLAIYFGETLAPRTETKIDDKAVDLLKRASQSEAAIALLAALLSGSLPPLATAGLSGDEKALCEELQANEHVLRVLRFASEEVA